MKLKGPHTLLQNVKGPHTLLQNVKGPHTLLQNSLPFSNNTARHHRGTSLFKMNQLTKSKRSPLQCHHGQSYRRRVCNGLPTYFLKRKGL